MRWALGALVVILATAASAEDLDALRAKAEHARQEQDLSAAEAAYEALAHYATEHPDDEAKLAAVRAALTVCEFNRYDYLKLNEIEKRRAVGDTIDALAKTAHETLATLPDTSEKFRLTADLYATMIRTQYHGKQYAKDMDAAASKALEMDPTNPDAYVTSSKRQLYAPEKRGGDVEAALEKLNKAIELNPQHAQAWVLRGIAHEKLGNKEAAQADWKKAQEINPHARAARENLDRMARGEALE
jgi:tetratricopeptide (TPR) repeat protein